MRRRLQEVREAWADNLTFATFEQWAQSQRELGMGRDAITEEEYLQSLAMQVWEVVKRNPTTFLQFIEAEWESLTRADANPIEAYKDYLRDFARRNVRKRVEDAKEESEEQDDVKNMGPEEWAAFIGKLPTVLQNLPLMLAERTMVDAGVMPSAEAQATIFPSVVGPLRRYARNILITGSDTLSTLLQKIAETTGIPLDFMKVVARDGRLMTELDQLRHLERHAVPFSVIDTRPKN